MVSTGSLLVCTTLSGIAATDYHNIIFCYEIFCDLISDAPLSAVDGDCGGSACCCSGGGPSSGEELSESLLSLLLDPVEAAVGGGGELSGTIVTGSLWAGAISLIARGPLQWPCSAVEYNISLSLCRWRLRCTGGS